MDLAHRFLLAGVNKGCNCGRHVFETVVEPWKHWMMDAFSVLLAATGFLERDMDSRAGYWYCRTTNFVGYLEIIVATSGREKRQRCFRWVVGRW